MEDSRIPEWSLVNDVLKRAETPVTEKRLLCKHILENSKEEFIESLVKALGNPSTEQVYGYLTSHDVKRGVSVFFNYPDIRSCTDTKILIAPIGKSYFRIVYGTRSGMWTITDKAVTSIGNSLYIRRDLLEKTTDKIIEHLGVSFGFPEENACIPFNRGAPTSGKVTMDLLNLSRMVKENAVLKDLTIGGHGEYIDSAIKRLLLSKLSCICERGANQSREHSYVLLLINCEAFGIQIDIHLADSYMSNRLLDVNFPNAMRKAVTVATVEAMSLMKLKLTEAISVLN